MVVNTLHKGYKQTNKQQQLMKTVVVAAAEVHSDGQFFFMYQKQEGKTKI